jgi:hypothetical protein
MKLRLLFLAFIGLTLVGCNEIGEFANIEEQVKERMEDGAKKIEALRAVAKQVNKSKKFNTYFKQCPAAHFGKEKSLMISTANAILGQEELDQHLCSFTPELCLSICLDGGTDACLSLAQALETVGTDKQIGVIPGRKAYALACATGSGSGCTNRGGGLLNYPTEADPLSQSAAASLYACTFALFQKGCKDDDGWGCVMLGQAYGRGQGVEKDINLSKQSFAKACADDTDDDMCVYAKHLQETLFQPAD